MEIKTIDDLKKDSIKEIFVFGIIGLVSILILKSHILERFVSDAMSDFFIQLVVVDIAVLALVCIIYVIYRFWIFINCLLIEKYMKKNHIDTKQDITWWNGRNCVLLSDMVLLCKFKILSFKYDEIESVQVVYNTNNRGRIVSYYFDFNLFNDVRYQVFMYSSNGFKYRNITDISEIVKDKNPNIIIKDKRGIDPFRDLI